MYICFANSAGVIYGHTIILADQQRQLQQHIQLTQYTEGADDIDTTVAYDSESDLLNPSVWMSNDGNDAFHQLGAVSLNPNGFVIVDRHPEQVSTQLNVDAMLDTVLYLITTYYHKINDSIRVYLPRMASNMLDEANIQYKFQMLMHRIHNSISASTCSKPTKPTESAAPAKTCGMQDKSTTSCTSNNHNALLSIEIKPV